MENAKKDIMKPESNHINMSPSNSKHNSTFPVGKVKKNSSVGKVVKPKITLKLPVPKKELSDESKPVTSQSQLKDEVSNTYDFSDKETDNHAKNGYVYVFKLHSQHIIKRKQGTKMYKCDVCGATYRHVFSLKRHFLRNHVNSKYLSEADISNCKINFCPDYEHHAAAKPGNVTNSEQRDSDSCKPHGNGKPADLFRCHRCLDLKFGSLSVLKQHFEMHQGSTKAQFSCDHCDAVFAQRLAFIRHKASHVNKKQFMCSTCDLNFDSRSSYLKHISTHSNGKACKHCGKIFSTSANRKRHERLHEGLKPYPCRHCSLGYTQSSDLKSHIKEFHRDLYYECSQCPRLLLSQESLKKHLSEKHSVSDIETPLTPSPPKATKPPVASQSALKTIPPSSLNRILSKPKLVSKPITNAPTPVSKTYVGSPCKTSFPSHMQLSKHTTNEHPHSLLQGKRKPPKKAINYSGYSVFKRRVMSSTRSRDLTEQEFYLSVSEQIRENLLNFVDGKPSQLSLKQSEMTSFSEPTTENSFTSVSEPWSSYNFPKDFDMRQSFQHAKPVIPSASVDSNTSDSQSDADCNLKLSEVTLVGKITDVTAPDSDSFAEALVDSDGSPSVNGDEPDEQCKEMSLEERKALIGIDVKVTCVCCVCSETFDSYELYYDHHVNNHPNVQSSYIKLEGTKDSPPLVPPGLCTQFVSPYGLLNHCHVPPSLVDQTDLICTKCKSKFPSVSDLHVHVIESCGGNESIVPTFIYKKQHRRIKRTMKNRMDTTVRHAYFVKRRPREICKHPDGKLSNTASIVSTEPLLPPSPKENNSEDLPKLLPETDQGIADKPQEPDYFCPICDKLCKTKDTLNAHVACCENGVLSENQGSICIDKNHCKSPSQEGLRSPVNTVVKMDRENERHGATSPSLECIVDSIKQKLTSDDMSSTHSSSSWMDEEPPPDISAECEPSGSPETDSGGKSCDSADHNENSVCQRPKDDKNGVIVAEMDLPVLTKELNHGSEKTILCSATPALSSDETNGSERTKKQNEENSTCCLPKRLNEDSLNSDVQNATENRICDSTSRRKSEENQKEGGNKECSNDKHLCPYCKVKFSHITNFRKHMDRCWKMQNKEGETSPQTSNVLLPNKDEVEASMLNLLRHQSRQSELMKEAENSTYANKKFQSYTCDLCHKIFLCYFKMLQHRVSHKLNAEDLIKTIAEQSEGSENKQNVKSDSEVTTKPDEVPCCTETSGVVPDIEEMSNCKRKAEEGAGENQDNHEHVQSMVSNENGCLSQPLELSSSSHNDKSRSASNSENSVPSHSDTVTVSHWGKRKKNLLPPLEEVKVKRKKYVTNSNSKLQRSSVGDGVKVPCENSSRSSASNELATDKSEISVKTVKSESVTKPVTQEKITKRKPPVMKSESSDILSDVQGTSNKIAKRKPQDECIVNKTSSNVLGTTNDNIKAESQDSTISKAGTSSYSLGAGVTPPNDSRDDVTCPICSKVFSAPFYRNRHVKHMHKVKEEKLKQTEKKKDKPKTTEEHKKGEKLKPTEEHKKGEKLKPTEEHKKGEKLKPTEEHKKGEKLKPTEEHKKGEKLKPTEEHKKGEKLKPTEEHRKDEKQTMEPKKEKIIAKIPRKKILPKNNRRVFQRQCKKEAIAKRISKQNGMKKTSPLRKSPPKKPLLVKKRSTRS